MKLLFVILSLVLFAISFKGNALDRSEESKTPKEIEIKISGTVIDSKTGEALAGVKIKIAGTNDEVYTNFNGEFEFKNLASGEYKLECEMVCYEQFNLNSIKIGTGDNHNKLVLRLTPATVKFRAKPKKYEPVACG